jgi:hypothetical protein
MTGETAALIDSFAGEPELHHPVRGRIKGARAFAGYVADTNARLEARKGANEVPICRGLGKTQTLRLAWS